VKLYYSPNSPYARKCLVVAYELGLRERIETIGANATPTKMDPDVAAKNPLGKVPTLILDDGTPIYDSPVIAEYLNALAGGDLLPREGPARWNALIEQALADGMLDAAILARFESVLRPENMRWNDWTSGQMAKVVGGFDELERRAGAFRDRVDIGTIAIACALGYIDLRFGYLEWRKGRQNAAAWFEKFAARESMLKTRPPG
jgi:glutathione S-transferase